MGIIRTAKIVFMIAIVASGIYFGYLAKDVLDAGVTDYSVEKIRSIDASGFTVDMSLSIQNPSRIDLKADRIEYTAILRDTGEVIASGTLDGLTLPASSEQTIEMSPRIRWIPSANLVAKYATQSEVWMDLELEIKVTEILPGISATVPVDIKEVFTEEDVIGQVTSVPNAEQPLSDSGIFDRIL